MPQIPLIFGKMDLESDQTSKRDEVLAQIYNGFRVGKSIHMWPSLAEYCDLGTGKPTWNWYSTLHGVHLAVSGGKLYRVTASGHTEITGTSLVDGTPPSFTEDAHRIFIAAGAHINFWTPGEPRVYLPRHGKIPPVVSERLDVTTDKAEFRLVYSGVSGVAASSVGFRYATESKNNLHYKTQLIIDGNPLDKAADETVGEHTLEQTGFSPGSHTIGIRMLDITTGEILAESPIHTLTVSSSNASAYIASNSVTDKTKTTVTFTYDPGDFNADLYDLYLSLDAGRNWSKVVERQLPGHFLDGAGITKVYTAKGLVPNTFYRSLLMMVSVSGNTTPVVSTLMEFTTDTDEAVTAEDNDASSPLTFTSQPAATTISEDSVTITYSTADLDRSTYKAEYSINGGVTWETTNVNEKPGAGKTIEIPDLGVNTPYTVLLRLTSNPSQAPVNVTSLAYMSGFLIAVGEDFAGGSLPGDFAFSDTQGEDGVPTYEKWDFENNATKPDALQAIIATTDGNLYGIGTETVDVSYISGSVDNPFAANTSAGQPFGTPAKHSAAYDSESGYFLAVIQGTRQIVKLVGGRVAQVVSFPVGVPIQEVRDITTARAMILSYRACPFYIITFPDADVTIDDSLHESLTLAYNIRMEEWAILGDWNTESGRYDAFKSLSFAYDQSVGYLGGTDGKIYTLAQEPRTKEPVFTHRWRNDGNLEWREGRTIPLGAIGDRQGPLKQRQCGRYYRRQDEFIFANADMRMCIRTGWRNWGKNVEKISKEYVYDVKRGDSGVVFNGVDEEITVL